MAAKKAKKYRSKFFRVALEGATCDGRTIERKDIEDMAATYSQGVYGARVWIDHIRGILPDSAFRAYGDVTALKAEEVDFNGSKKLALFAQIDPTEDLVTIVNVQKQKVFTSIELAPDFAGSGKAYLYGLAVTDNPASLGTEMLAFAVQHPDNNPLTKRKQLPENVFSVAEESAIELEEVTQQDPPPSKIAALFAAMGFKPKTAPESKPEEAPDVGEFMAQVLEAFSEQAEEIASLKEQLALATGKQQQFAAQLAGIAKTLNETPQGFTKRPAVTGKTSDDDIDC